MPKVSVIIPVYGVESYIERCARSLFEQTLDDIEYIFVNDCTPDNSILILQKTLNDYPNRKEQVRIIDMQKNSGQGAVRKRGMMEAKGDYIIHCDSDDWIEKDMYEKMYNLALSSGSDIVTCDFIMECVGGGENSLIISQICDVNPRSHIVNYANEQIWWTLWSRMYRRQLLTDNNIYPVEGMNMWEDVYISLQAYYYANKVENIREALYHYDTSREGRIIKKQYEDFIIQQQVLCIRLLEEFFIEVNFDASQWLNVRKTAIKSKYLQVYPINFTGFRRCFPELKKNYKSKSKLYCWCWKVIISGNIIPYIVYIYCIKIISLSKRIFKKLIKR